MENKILLQAISLAEKILSETSRHRNRKKIKLCRIRKNLKDCWPLYLTDVVYELEKEGVLFKPKECSKKHFGKPVFSATFVRKKAEKFLEIHGRLRLDDDEKPKFKNGVFSYKKREAKFTGNGNQVKLIKLLIRELSFNQPLFFVFVTRETELTKNQILIAAKEIQKKFKKEVKDYCRLRVSEKEKTVKLEPTG